MDLVPKTSQESEVGVPSRRISDSSERNTKTQQKVPKMLRGGAPRSFSLKTKKSSVPPDFRACFRHSLCTWSMKTSGTTVLASALAVSSYPVESFLFRAGRLPAAGAGVRATSLESKSCDSYSWGHEPSSLRTAASSAPRTAVRSRGLTSMQSGDELDFHAPRVRLSGLLHVYVSILRDTCGTILDFAFNSIGCVPQRQEAGVERPTLYCPVSLQNEPLRAMSTALLLPVPHRRQAGRTMVFSRAQMMV